VVRASIGTGRGANRRTTLEGAARTGPPCQEETAAATRPDDAVAAQEEGVQATPQETDRS
jgi:hypothetical protein